MREAITFVMRIQFGGIFNPACYAADFTLALAGASSKLGTT